MKNYSFRIIIEPDEKNTFHGFVPSLHGCHTWGKTFEETRENLRDAIKAYVLSLIEDGESIPQEKGLEAFETISINPLKKSVTYA
jgi:predicted RNase H-like HicB family nuclease